MTTVKGKTKTVYRILCPNYGTRGHSTHEHTKPTLAKARERAAGNDRLYQDLVERDSEMSSYYESEIGWRVQAQIVTEWEDIE